MRKAKTYLIKAGSHTAKNRLPGLFIGRSVNFLVTFDKSAVIQFKEAQNALDVSKVYGISESLNPHYNSARIGFAFVDGKLRLYAYSYCRGVRTIQELCVIEIGQTYKCRITLDRLTYDKYVFYVMDTVHDATLGFRWANRGNNRKCAIGYKLFPYIGGNEVLDHDFTVKIERL